jgi:hypothetical protein
MNNNKYGEYKYYDEDINNKSESLYELFNLMICNVYLIFMEDLDFDGLFFWQKYFKPMYIQYDIINKSSKNYKWKILNKELSDKIINLKKHEYDTHSELYELIGEPVMNTPIHFLIQHIRLTFNNQPLIFRKIMQLALNIGQFKAKFDKFKWPDVSKEESLKLCASYLKNRFNELDTYLTKDAINYFSKIVDDNKLIDKFYKTLHRFTTYFKEEQKEKKVCTIKTQIEEFENKESDDVYDIIKQAEQELKLLNCPW